MSAILPRSSVELPHAEFQQLLDVTFNRPWLRRRGAALSELWQLCNTPEKKDLILDLIEHFHVMDFNDVEVICSTIKRHVETEWTTEPSSTLFVAVSDDFEADGSQMALQFLKNQFEQTHGWKDSNFRNTLLGYDSYLKAGRTYILLDDFVGSGRTIVRKVTAFVAALKERGISDAEVHVVSLAAMHESRPTLDSAGISYFSPLWLCKGIDGHNDETAAQAKRTLMRSIEKSLMHRFDGQYLPGLGYNGAQALFSFGGTNCPNNVFPVFWWPKYADQRDRATILRRLR